MNENRNIIARATALGWDSKNLGDEVDSDAALDWLCDRVVEASKNEAKNALELSALKSEENTRLEELEELKVSRIELGKHKFDMMNDIILLTRQLPSRELDEVVIDNNNKDVIISDLESSMEEKIKDYRKSINHATSLANRWRAKVSELETKVEELERNDVSVRGWWEAALKQRDAAQDREKEVREALRGTLVGVDKFVELMPGEGLSDEERVHAFRAGSVELLLHLRSMPPEAEKVGSGG